MRIFKTKEYRIVSVSGKLLTAAEDGAVTVEEQDSQKAQRWKFIPTDGAYRICNLQYQKMLDIIAGGTVNGAWVHLWDEVEAASQLWTAKSKGIGCGCARFPATNIWTLPCRTTPMCRSGKKRVRISFGLWK